MIRKFYGSLFLNAVLLLSFAFPAFAATGVLDAIQKRYDGIKSTRSRFEQTLTHKESGIVEKRQGTLYFQKPLQVRWETESPSPELLVVNDKEIWNYFEDEDLAYKYPPDLVADSSSIINVITGQAKIKQDFDIEDKGKEGGLIKLMLYPHKPTQSLIEAVLWADPATNLIKRFKFYDFYGNENDITFVEQEIDPKLDKKQFSYTPDPKTKVEDRSSSGAVQSPLLR